MPEGPEDARNVFRSTPSVPKQGVIKGVRGHGERRGIPEAFEMTLEHDDGSTIELRMPRPRGPATDAPVLPVKVHFRDFGECPICLAPDARHREHVPPSAIGGNVMTLTCQTCNNEFGSRFEPALLDWYEGAMGRLTVEGGDILGRRRGGKLLARETATGDFIAVHVGGADPAMGQILESGEYRGVIVPLDKNAVQVAAVKSAYLVACLVLGEVPRTPRANDIREQLVAARDAPRGEAVVTPLLAAILVRPSDMDPVPGDLRLVELHTPDKTVTHMISFNRRFAVDWPLDPIAMNDAGDVTRLVHP